MPSLVQLPATSNCITLLYVYDVQGGDYKVILVFLPESFRRSSFHIEAVIVEVTDQNHGYMLPKRTPKQLFKKYSGKITRT